MRVGVVLFYLLHNDTQLHADYTKKMQAPHTQRHQIAREGDLGKEIEVTYLFFKKIYGIREETSNKFLKIMIISGEIWAFYGTVWATPHVD